MTDPLDRPESEKLPLLLVGAANNVASAPEYIVPPTGKPKYAASVGFTTLKNAPPSIFRLRMPTDFTIVSPVNEPVINAVPGAMPSAAMPPSISSLPPLEKSASLLMGSPEKLPVLKLNVPESRERLLPVCSPVVSPVTDETPRLPPTTGAAPPA